jgi:acyl phosphate:glycerol-3-phosphate acyltransferase
MLSGMSTAAGTLVAAVAGYLLGSLPIADYVARRSGIELRAAGDRNPGYWNAKVLLGRRAAVPVFVGDVLKGAIAAGIGRSLGGPWWVGYVAGGLAMAGHAWPLFARFRGGRSILTFVGAICVLAPMPAAICLAGCVTICAMTRSFAWGARVGVFAFPLVQAVFDARARVAATGAMMSLIGLRFAIAGWRSRESAVRSV